MTLRSISLGLCFAGSLAVSTLFTIDHILNRRVVGGEPADAADKGTYPYVVSLQSNGNHSCGGTIVHKNYVITAAHCVDGVSASDLTIKVGTNKLSCPGQVYKVLKINIHENYNRSDKFHDVAILEVEEIDLSLPNISTIRAETKFIEAGETLTMAGWGTFRDFGEYTPNYLRHALLASISVEDCQAVVGKSQVHDNQICAWTQFGKRARWGYSGGPLLKRVEDHERLVGIMSWGTLDPQPKDIDGFERVSSYISWFNDHCDNCLK